MKRLLFIIPFFLIACKGNKNHMLESTSHTKEDSIFTIENSQFIKEFNFGDTLRIINERHYCEYGPFTETFEFFQRWEEEPLICRYEMESGWRYMEKETIMVILFNVTDNVINSYLAFEKDVINKATGKDDDSCTFYEYFDIVLNTDTISSAHSDCSYEGFENFRKELKRNFFFIEPYRHNVMAPPFE